MLCEGVRARAASFSRLHGRRRLDFERRRREQPSAVKLRAQRSHQHALQAPSPQPAQVQRTPPSAPNLNHAHSPIPPNLPPGRLLPNILGKHALVLSIIPLGDIRFSGDRALGRRVVPEQELGRLLRALARGDKDVPDFVGVDEFWVSAGSGIWGLEERSRARRAKSSAWINDNMTRRDSTQTTHDPWPMAPLDSLPGPIMRGPIS
jgi:hypothetical protein